MVAYRQMVVSRRLGTSQTAIEVINGRWTMDWFGIRPDPASAQLARVLPNTSLLGLRLCLLPLWLKYKLSGTYFAYPRLPPPGGAETVADLFVARTLYFGRILERVLPEVEQFVLLGAGYDTRAYGPLMSDGVACFELDHPRVQELKRSNLGEAGIDASRVTFVPVDFGRDDAFEKLAASGYDPGRKTAFLWEGVTLYLGEDDVRKTLRGVRAHASPYFCRYQITPKTSRYTRCSMSMLPNVSINRRIRSSGQLGRWWYSISPCRNNECVRRFTVFAFNQRS